MVHVSRKMNFSAAHRLFNPELSEKENELIYDKCNNYHGHGHNYTLIVTVKGKPDPKTGYVIDLKKLRDIIQKEIIDKVDHKHLNFDVDFLQGIIPSAENLTAIFWKILETKIPVGKLHSIKLYESENNFVEYFGEEFEIIKFDSKDVNN